VTGRLAKNLYAVLPIGTIFGMWFALLDNFQVVVLSPRLSLSIKSLSLFLVYGYLANLVVAIVLVVAVSLIARTV